MLIVTFLVDPACAGGHHFNMTANIDGRKVTFPVLMGEFPEDFEVDEAVQVLAHSVLGKDGLIDQSAIKSSFDVKSWSL